MTRLQSDRNPTPLAPTKEPRESFPVVAVTDHHTLSGLS